MENGQDEDENLSEGSFQQNLLDLPVIVQLRNKIGGQKPSSRAPTMTIDVVHVGRPLKVLAILFDSLCLLLFFVGSVSTFWFQINDTSYGIYKECIRNQKLILKQTNCRTRDYRKLDVIGAMLFNVASVLLTAVGIITFILGMFSYVSKQKRMYYNVTIFLHTVANAFMLSCVLITTLVNYTKLQSNETISIQWSQIVVCIGIVALFVGEILLIADKHAEEIEYRETIHQDSSEKEND